MSKIYIVTSDDIEDHSPAAAFSTEDLANEYLDSVGDGYRFVVELEVDKYIRQIRDGLTIYTVTMDRAGNILNKSNSYYWFESGLPGDEKWCWSLNRTHVPDLLVSVLATSAEHAIGIVDQQRAELVASELWPNRKHIEYSQPNFSAESFEEFKAVTRERIGGGG